MNRIRLLSEQVANQIAAGEVVERPASVVKELLENALDAGASRVAVEVAGGGRSLIRVTDDGLGMSRDDALLCLERHATSKLRAAEDLRAIATFGFRGEALPSIASVSRFTLITRERGDTSGEAARVVVNGGRIIQAGAGAGPTGTQVEVRNLFFNLPARRKFLRAEATELAHIEHIASLAAAAHPHVAFTFVSDARTVWELPSAGATDPLEALGQRLRQMRGGDTPLAPVQFQARWREAAVREPEAPEGFADSADGTPPESLIHIWGFVGAPGVSRSTRDEQRVFVNRRPVEHRGLNWALAEGYHHSLMKGRHPVCCLFLDIDPDAVDVNVHPQKREVRFRDEAAVRRCMAQAVREALISYHTRSEQREEATPVAPSPLALAPISAAPDDSPALRPAAVAAPARLTLPAVPTPADGARRQPVGAEPRRPAPPTPPTPPASPVKTPPEAPLTPTPLLAVPLRLIGVAGHLYAVWESDRGLVLMDQHAAHERVLFEAALSQLEAGGPAPCQRLLLPETLELEARDADFLRRHLDPLSRLGVGLREFGDRTFLLDGLPPFVRVGNPKRFALDLVDQLRAAGAGVNSFRLGEEAIAKTVCRHSVKANDALRAPELEELLESLRRCSMPYTCPHGRPTLIEMNWRDLERRFGRTS